MATISETLAVTEQKTYNLEISLWSATVNLSTTSSEFYGQTVTVTSPVLSTPGSVTFSSTGYATYKAKKAGTYTFSITYNGEIYSTSVNVAQETTYSATLNTLEIVSWKDGTDEQIVALIEAADKGQVDLAKDCGWAVNDERTVTLNAISAGTYNVAHSSQQVTLVLMDTNHYDLTDSTATTTGKCHFVVGFKDALAELEKMEETATNANGWHNSRGRKCCDAVFNMIPATLQPIFKKFKVVTASAGNNDSASLNTYTEGKLALFAEKEISDAKSYSATTEVNALTQIEYYRTAANRIKKQGSTGNAYYWWERSPNASGAAGFCGVNAGGGASSYDARAAIGLAPFGVI